MLPARQWGLVDVATGGAGDNVTTKGPTGSIEAVDDLCGRLRMRSRLSLGRREAVTQDLYGSTSLL